MSLVYLFVSSIRDILLTSSCCHTLGGSSSAASPSACTQHRPALLLVAKLHFNFLGACEQVSPNHLLSLLFLSIAFVSVIRLILVAGCPSRSPLAWSSHLLFPLCEQSSVFSLLSLSLSLILTSLTS